MLVAAEAARCPAGTVTRACSSSATREGAFRLLENAAVRPGAIRTAMEGATARRCKDEALIFVAVDATSLTITDRTCRKGLGGVGSWSHGSRGVHVTTALAVSSGGSALGICGQQMWVRESRSPHGRHRRLAAQPTEIEHWLEVLVSSHSKLATIAPQCTPWYQMDRGADCWQVLTLARELDMLVTVRAVHDRCLDGGAQSLWNAVEQAPVIATRRVALADGREPVLMRRRVGHGRRVFWRMDPRKARVAKVEIRSASVPVLLRTPHGETFTVPFHAVLVREKAGPADPIEWMLLTTHPVDTPSDALKVVDGYTMRWRIEELHRTWKRGLCRVEDTQLRSRDAIFKWATILCAVATRAMRLTRLARSTPDVLATTEFSRVELDALIALREPKNVKQGTIPTLAQAVRWLADLGGYTGPWNGPPGATVIGRGLHDVLVAARAFENRDKK